MTRYGYHYYTPTVAKKVKGGIKAQSKRGAFASHWWAKRWIETLEGFHIGTRLTRGKAYARKGQVADLDVAAGKVQAAVQGSRARAYRVSIQLKEISARQWRKVAQRINTEPIFAAQLLGGEMPEDVEALFDEAGAPLFPQRQGDLETECSCPDWSNPCKHIAAVYYLLAEAFDRDPFLLFTLRGMDREQFLAQLHSEADGTAAQEAYAPEPLPLDHDVFWGVVASIPDAAPARTPCTLHAALPKRLGSLPFWRAETDFIEAMEAMYRHGGHIACTQLFDQAMG